MNILLSLFLSITLAFSVFAEDIKIIELHDQTIDRILLNATNDNDDANNDINTEELKSSTSATKEQDIIIDPEESESSEPSESVTAFPDFWENADKDDVLFLFDNLLLTNSLILNNTLIDALTLNSLPPQGFEEDEFNHFKIVNLIKLGQRKKAFNMIETLNEKTDYLDAFNLFKLNYYFSTYELNQACDFSNSFNRKESKINENYLLKVDIFCTFLQNKTEEADFLNSLLEEMDDQDDYFQKIFLNLKRSSKNKEDFTLLNYDENSMSLYSAMIRVGEMPLNNKYLMKDPVNFSMPIILSGSSDISLRLKASHKAYQQGIFNADSLSALYQTVDFSYDELTNIDLEKFHKNFEIGMAYLFQKANIQLLPITRVQSLVDFWSYAEKENYSSLAYDISRNLIDKIEPSPELSEHGIEIAKAHIHNSNFKLADKWILFAENYQSEDENFAEKIQSIKLLYKLKKSTNDKQFINILLNSDVLKGIHENIIKQEILLTIASVINENNNEIFNGNRNLYDQRSVPSIYLLNKIKQSSKTNNYGELLLSINISMVDKSWEETHPEHLRIILTALRDIEIENFFKDVILEILKASEII
ncbi:MAG: hypothetical protein HVK41_03465 [Pelagibacteraceae bacterium]|jgi:hypothetical protein|nr:hypothetical protein [Pelagibacteraceae bacterium]HJO13505.1 hypothetical protein [Alphaproteobacteria bacterium]MBO6466836.1 hypothetical protein [Pelagibacteraceae bacterium]MBO6467148.1 hypothetical protein [Pelagibacteraceae bacterium]MBO6470062.1 hypothetical protein [Pelagibacteraceae bacterium]|tara:strand:+ start:66 stop:1838 length:1773 start_codon:yes stop_codon:yes gene_type:complete